MLIPAVLMSTSINLLASDPPPGHGETGNVPGGGAPLGS